MYDDPIYVDELTCEVCGKTGPDVHEIECGWSKDLHGESVMEIICDACEEQHCDDI